MDASLLTQLLVNGICVGLGYGLAALGLALLFGVLEQVNFAHGELYTLGAFTLWVIASRWHPSWWLLVPMVVVVLAAAGWVLARGVLLPTLDSPFETGILATLAVSIIAQNGVRLLFGATPQHVASPLEGLAFDVGGVLLFGQRCFAAILAVAAVSALTLFLQRTATGRAMRAMAQNRDACFMVGIDVKRITCISAAISAGLCGLAAAAIAPMFDLYPNMGTDVTFKSFAVIIIGGMGNLGGAIAAGLLLGVAESFAGGLAGAAWRDGIGFTLMILILLLRPHGIFGRSVRV